MQEVFTDPIPSPNPTAPGVIGYSIYTAREYVWGPDRVDELVAQMTPAGAVLYALHDVGGNLVGLVSTAGSVVYQYTFDPYGELLATETLGTPTMRSRVGHKGLIFDRLGVGTTSDQLVAGALGLYQNRNRTYAPHLGRFTTRDPNATGLPLLIAAMMSGQVVPDGLELPDLRASLANGANVYAYLGSSPLLRSDALGLRYDPFEDHVDDFLAESAGSKAAFMEELSAGFDAMLYIGFQVAQLHPAVMLAMAAHNIASGSFSIWDLAAVIPGGGVARAVVGRAGIAMTQTRSARQLSKAMHRAEDILPAAFKGPATTYVYLGWRSGRPVYVGVTSNLKQRQGQHGSRFQIRPITPKLPRLQAKAVETLIQIGNPHFENRIAGIGKNNAVFHSAITWAGAWVKKHGLRVLY